LEIQSIKASISANTSSIENLVNSIANAQDTAASKFLIDKINELDEQNSKLKSRLLQLQESKQSNVSDIAYIGIIDNLANTFSSTVDMLDAAEKRSLLKSIVERITWDGANANIEMFSKKNVSAMYR
jgi:site-specific DNA recombinase